MENKKMLKNIEIASRIVLHEDKKLFKELAEEDSTQENEDLTCIKADYCNCGGSRCKGKYHEKWCNSMENKNNTHLNNE